MDEKTILKTIVAPLTAAVDYPVTQSERLLATLPPHTATLPAAIYLTPFGDDPPAKAKACARGLTAMFYALLYQNDIDNRAAFTAAEAVLYGDYLFALGISHLATATTGDTTLLKAARRSWERRCRRLRGDAVTDAEVAADYGRYFRAPATEALAALDREDKAYLAAAEAVGGLWGLLYEGRGTDSDTAFRSARDTVAACADSDALIPFIQSWEEAMS